MAKKQATTPKPAKPIAVNTDAKLTDAPPTDAPLTDAPLTDAPPTDATPTDAPPTDAPVPYEPTPKEINELIEQSHKALDKQSAREVLLRNHAEAQAAQ